MSNGVNKLIVMFNSVHAVILIIKKMMGVMVVLAVTWSALAVVSLSMVETR